jgi:hypothetical protein
MIILFLIIVKYVMIIYKKYSTEYKVLNLGPRLVGLAVGMHDGEKEGMRLKGNSNK